RMIYVKYFASQRFVKKVVLICDREQVEELATGLENVDPHYKVMGFVNSDSNSVKSANDYVTNIEPQNLEQFVRQSSVSEIVIASKKTDGITVNLYNQLIHLLENGYIIREYTQVYEAITHRIP